MSSILLTLNTPDGLILLRKETQKKLALNKWVGMVEIFYLFSHVMMKNCKSFQFQSRKHAYLHVEITNSYVCSSIHPLSKEHKK